MLLLRPYFHVDPAEPSKLQWRPNPRAGQYATVFDLAEMPLSAENISGELTVENIPALPAAIITSGTFDAARIPTLSYAAAVHTHSAADINSGTLDVARLPVPMVLTDNTALTNAVSDVLTLTHRTSGTPAAGFGTRLVLSAEDSAADDQPMAALRGSWLATTHGSQRSKVRLTGYLGSTEIEVLNADVQSSGRAFIGFGVAPVWGQPYEMQGNLMIYGTASAPTTTLYLRAGAAGANGKIRFQDSLGNSATDIDASSGANTVITAPVGFQIASPKFAAYSGAPVTKQTVSGSRGGNAALQSLIAALAAMNLITDSSSA